LAYLGSTGLVYASLHQIRPAWALPGTVFFAWNPLVLFESVGNAHNDIVMVFFFMLAVWAYLHFVEQPSIWTALVFTLGFAASILVKFVTILVLPFFLLGCLLIPPTAFNTRNLLRTWVYRIAIPCLLGLAILLVVILMMAPVWPGLDQWALLRAGKGAGRSAVALLVLAIRPYAGSTSRAFDLTNGLIYFVFGAIYFWGIWRVVCPGKKCFPKRAISLETVRSQPLLVSFYVFFYYALFVATVFHAWYLLWFMPLAALLVPNRRVISGAFVFTLMALLIIPYYETIRVWFPYLNQNHLLGHAIGVPLLLIPVGISLWKPLSELAIRGEDD
jgi:hypothetical protein